MGIRRVYRQLRITTPCGDPRNDIQARRYTTVAASSTGMAAPKSLSAPELDVTTGIRTPAMNSTGHAITHAGGPTDIVLMPHITTALAGGAAPLPDQLQRLSSACGLPLTVT
jgi:hypothetical protein